MERYWLENITKIDNRKEKEDGNIYSSTYNTHN